MVRPSVDTSVILEAAADLAADRGYDNSTMESIAAHAGVAKGVLYLRFSSKDELLAAIVDREIVLATRHMAQLVDDDERGGMLSRLYAHSVTALHARPALLRFYQDERSHLARLVERADGERHRRRMLIGAEFIRALQTQGMVVPSLDAEVLSANLSLWSYGLAVRAPHADVEALILGMGDLLTRSVDTDAIDTTPGKRCFAMLAEALIDERSLS